MPDHADRRVVGNTIVSARMPAVEITMAETLTYVGGLHFILAEVAQAQAFVFVAERHHEIEQALIVQFEGFLPGKGKTYTYPSPRLVTLGRHPFQADTALLSLTPPPPPETNVGRILTLLEERGYELPAAALSSRFVRVLGEARRDELLIFGIEPLTDADLIAELKRAGRPIPAPTAVTQAAEERALASFTVVDRDEQSSEIPL